jgi:hypothetical protein
LIKLNRYSPDGKGATPGQTIVLMITNLCPPQAPWCSDGLNGYQYSAHFDIANNPTAGLYAALGWDNAEVMYLFYFIIYFYLYYFFFVCFYFYLSVFVFVFIFIFIVTFCFCFKYFILCF